MNSNPSNGDAGDQGIIIGVGGAGIKILKALQDTAWRGSTLAAADTDGNALAETMLPNALTIGARTTRGLGAGGDPAVGRAAFEEDAENLARLWSDKELMITLAGLGRGTGSGVTPGLVRQARVKQKGILCVVTLPFDYEGEAAAQHALTSLSELRKLADAVLVVPNQELFTDCPRRRRPMLSRRPTPGSPAP